MRNSETEPRQGSFLLVGLGNPGPKYKGTPHNVGFEVINRLAERYSAEFVPSKQVEAMAAGATIQGHPVHLLKPLTYMNLSGSAVAPFIRRKSISADHLLIISDDIDLPIGRIRLREKGSHGGHKGLLSVINSLGTKDLQRLRIGIRPPDGDVGDTVEYVLSKLPPEEKEHLSRVCDVAVEAAECFLKDGMTAAMNRYNSQIVE